MRIHLIKEKTIKEYFKANPQSKASLKRWIVRIKRSDWNTPHDIKETFDYADLLGRGSNRAIFDIGGNHYRMICKYVFGETECHLFVCWIGSHAEYTKLCEDGAQYVVTIY